MKKMTRQEAEDLIAKCTFHATQLAVCVDEMVAQEKVVLKHHATNPLKGVDLLECALLLAFRSLQKMGGIE
jgi:hypothetical protein